MHRNVLELLQQTGCFIETPTKRGRPALTNIFRGGALIAQEVFRVEYHLPSTRRTGRFMAAVRVVAARRRMQPDSVKRTATRYRKLRALTVFAEAAPAAQDEANHRMRRFPDDVRAWCSQTMSFAGLLRFLREHDIDGTCPQWLADLARR